MKAYLCVLVNYKQNNWAQLLPMAEFVYNNSKNVSTGHTPSKLNCGYHLCISFKNKCDVYSRSFSAKKLAIKLRELMNVYCQNLLHAQNLQKQVYDKGVKSWCYAPGEKILLNNKHIKRKRNWKLEAIILGLFEYSTW